MPTRVIHNITFGAAVNENYTTRDAIMQCKDRLTFDGVYRNVYANRDILGSVCREAPHILFVMGDHVGRDNRFDHTMPREQFATWDEIVSLCRFNNCELGWHTWSHRNLTELNDVELQREVTPPWPMRTFAYPYGAFDKRVVEAVKRAGFTEAFSVHKGDDSQFERLRAYL